MKITLIAATRFLTEPESVEGTAFADYHDRHQEPFYSADRLAHFSGRSCYQAWNMPNPATSNDKGYLGNIINQGHFSVLEHASVSFYVEGVSRSLLAELTRHRHVSFSVESQRYVDYSDTEPVIPPAARGDEFAEALIREEYARDLAAYEKLYRHFTAQRGLNRKQAREAARSVLGNYAPVSMVVSGNHRAWRDVLGKRLPKSADAEIREYARLTLHLLKEIAPGSYQDIEDEDA